MRALKINVLVNGRHGCRWVGRDGWTDGQARAGGRTDALFNASLVSQRIGRSPSPSPSPSPVYLQRGKREDDITRDRKVAMRRFD